MPFFFKKQFISLVLDVMITFKISGLMKGFFYKALIFLANLYKFLRKHLNHFRKETLFVCQLHAARKSNFYIFVMQSYDVSFYGNAFWWQSVPFYVIQIALSLLHLTAENLDVPLSKLVDVWRIFLVFETVGFFSKTVKRVRFTKRFHWRISWKNYVLILRWMSIYRLG